MKHYYLSISIPTYNRLIYLDKNIENILKQIYKAKLEDKICIDVFDNCSSDKTYQFLKTKYKDYDNFYIHSSNTNRGMDVNFQRCIYESSSDDYVWLLSDDDIVIDDGISTIFDKIIKNKEISLFYLNLYSFEGNFNSATKLPIKFKLEDDFITNNIDSFINVIGIWITFLSSIVINKKNLISKDESEKYIGTYFIQSHIALNNLKGGKYAMITKDPIVACRGGNTRGYNLYYV